MAQQSVIPSAPVLGAAPAISTSAVDPLAMQAALAMQGLSTQPTMGVHMAAPGLPGPGGVQVVPPMPGIPNQLPQMVVPPPPPMDLSLGMQLPGLSATMPGVAPPPPGLPPGLGLPVGLAQGLQLPGVAGGIPMMLALGMQFGMPSGLSVGTLPTQVALAPQNSDAMHQAVYARHAVEYEQEKTFKIAPEITELCEHHGCDERAARALHDEMMKRKETFDEDLQALWIGLEGAKNPSGMLMLKVKDMRQGIFRGMSALKGKIHEWAKRNRLDTQAAVKLAEVLDAREDPDGDMAKLEKHMERSNKPSSLVMMMLKDLREGKPVAEPKHAAAIGSRVHESEIKKHAKKKSSSRGRRRRSRSRSRSRSRDRRDRRDRKGRSRDRDRKRKEKD